MNTIKLSDKDMFCAEIEEILRQAKQFDLNIKLSEQAQDYFEMLKDSELDF